MSLHKIWGGNGKVFLSYFGRSLLAFCIAVALSLVSYQISYAQTIVADHTVIPQFDNGSLDPYLAPAISKRVYFKHASTGGYIQGNQGLSCLQGTGTNSLCTGYPDYKYDRRNWNWPYWSPTEYTACEKIDQFYDSVVSENTNYDYLGMKLCYLDTYAGNCPNQSYFEYYRDKMLDLERRFSGKKLIWATQVLRNQWDGSDCQTAQNFNTQLRSFARSNGKLLYDLAGIESHHADGSACYFNGCETLCPEYLADPTNPKNGHTGITGSLRLAKGFWWLMVRAAGGTVPSVSPVPTSVVTATPTQRPINTLTPVPTSPVKRGDANGDGFVDEEDYNVWLAHYLDPNLIVLNQDPDFNGDNKVDGVDYAIWLNNYGSV